MGRGSVAAAFEVVSVAVDGLEFDWVSKTVGGEEFGGGIDCAAACDRPAEGDLGAGRLDRAITGDPFCED